jgi:hypothetical protein
VAHPEFAGENCGKELRFHGLTCLCVHRDMTERFGHRYGSGFCVVNVESQLNSEWLPYRFVMHGFKEAGNGGFWPLLRRIPLPLVIRERLRLAPSSQRGTHGLLGSWVNFNLSPGYGTCGDQGFHIRRSGISDIPVSGAVPAGLLLDVLRCKGIWVRPHRAHAG